MAEKVVVVGAGLAGLTAADTLNRAGAEVLVLEKSRGLGGRLATRRTDFDTSFDHGAQYVRARDPYFEKFIEKAVLLGNADTWKPSGLSDGPPAVVGTPGMSTLVAPLTDGIAIERSCLVTKVLETSKGAKVNTEDGRSIDCRAAIVTVPAPQAMEIIQDEKLRAQVSSALIAPCWAVLACSKNDWIRQEDLWANPCSEIAWIARNNSKPQREVSGTSWVIHAAPQWSRDNLERDPNKIVDMVMSHFCRIVRIPLHEIIYTAAHRWRFALVELPLGRPFASNELQSVYCGGDWCLGPRAENAFQSGRAIALDVLRAFNK